jgi:hypothetical protein
MISVDALGRLAAFTANLNFLVETHGVALDCYSDQFLVVDGKSTPLNLVLNDEGTYDVSIVVSL